MKAWLENLVGPDYATALLWTVVALIVLLVLLVAIRIVRGLSVGTFVSGGRHRKARLAVMDATAVDSHRRLILVRRDDVEHLILIGGPTDVVVEQNIRMVQPARRATVEDGPMHRAQEAAFAHEPASAPAPVREQPRPVAAPARPAPAPAPAPAIQPREPAAFVPPPAAPARPEPRPAQPAPAVQPMRPVVTPPAVVAPSSPRTEAPVRADLDDALLKELEVSLDKELPPPPAPKPATPPRVDAARPAGESLDEEMSKLLRDLAGNRQ